MAATTPISDVVIVGAGPVGMFAALELARHCTTNIRIIDPKPTTCQFSRALATHARTLELASHHPGLVEELLVRGTAIKEANVYREGGHMMGKIEFAETNLDTKYPFILGMPQTLTEDILHKYLARQYNIHVEWNTRMDSVVAESDFVTLNVTQTTPELADSPPTTTATIIQGRFVIACDGGRSPTRKSFHVPFKGHPVPLVLMNVDIYIQCDHPGIMRGDTAVMVSTPNAFMALLPCEHKTGRVRIVGSTSILPPKENSTEGLAPPTVEDVQKAVDERAPWLNAHVRDPQWLSHFSSQERKVDVDGYRPHPRVFLAGDAAHVHLPIGGWGMNTGIQDVTNLAWKLALQLRTPRTITPVNALLNSYAQERSPIATRLLQQTEPNALLASPSSLLARFIRAVAIPVALRLPFVRSFAVANLTMMSLGYGELDAEGGVSAMLHLQSKGRKGLGSGARAPDASICQLGGDHATGRIYDLVFAPSRGFCILIFPGKRVGKGMDTLVGDLKSMISERFGAQIFDIHCIVANGAAVRDSLQDAGAHGVDQSRPSSPETPSTPSTELAVWKDVSGDVYKRYGISVTAYGGPSVVLVRADRYIGGVFEGGGVSKAVEWYLEGWWPWGWE